MERDWKSVFPHAGSSGCRIDDATEARQIDNDASTGNTSSVFHKERPIIFSALLVQAILSGLKTQTRRIMIKANMHHGIPDAPPNWAAAVYPARESGWIAWGPKDSSNLSEFTKKQFDRGFECPFGQVGDRLWVRETWADVNTENGPAFAYRAGGIHFCVDDAYPVEYGRYPGMEFCVWYGDLMRGEDGHRWRPSIFMPRFASRMILEITGIRVQRLQEITEEDARAEGCTDDCDPYWMPSYGDPDSGGNPSCRKSFEYLWDRINATRATWESNPWVWAISFRRVES